MSWGASTSFPRAIIHVDGDAFFASCEVAKNPKLRGKPVVTGKERGIVSAATYEAKRLGIKRGVPLREVRRICPEAIILPSDYETYSLFSKRMYSIVRRYTPTVEEYSIDECFADLTGTRRVNRMNYPDMARALKRELDLELGMTFSVGLSCTKVLAKIGSKWQKPDGFTVIPLKDAAAFLKKTAVGSVWGIGPNTAAYLNKFGVRSAFEFAQKDDAWVCEKVSKPFVEIWRELRGEVVYELNTDGKSDYQSISKTKTFTPPSRDPDFVFSQLSKNIENACIKARRWDLASPEIFFFLKTQDFKYHGFEIRLPHATSVPQDVLHEVSKFFPRVFEKGKLYRATGVTLTKLRSAGDVQLDLFGGVVRSEGFKKVFESVDELSARYGKHAVFLGSSFTAMKFGAHLGERGDTPERLGFFSAGGGSSSGGNGETARKRLSIPMLGEVT